jgi:hypothetical protein
MTERRNQPNNGRDQFLAWTGKADIGDWESKRERVATTAIPPTTPT